MADLRVANAQRGLRPSGVAPTSPSAEVSATPFSGDRYPGYDGLELIGQGGQGVVYRAVQVSTRRTVALKVLAGGGFAQARTRQRFQREIELASSLRHRNIVTVYDSGVSDHGRDFCVMEFVEGAPLDRYVSSGDHQTVARRPIRETLALFQKIAAAVQYAHERGVIHRDLKPGNILVDRAGEPRVLDFGLAKTIGVGGDRSPAVTVSGDFVGTLAYASPEQTSGDVSQIDTRTDIYSLGVILYELLTGRQPCDVSGSLQQVLDNIRNVEPPPPSRWRPEVDDELDTIVARALHKDRARRYPTVEALSRDLDLYLRGEVIDAKRDSRWYVLRKTLRRYRMPATLAGIGVLLLLGFGVTMAVLYRRATAAEAVALQERGAALQQATRATQIRSLLEGALTSVQPERARGRDVSILREILDEAARRMDAELADQPEVEGELRNIIATTYERIGLYDECERHARRAVEVLEQLRGRGHPDTAAALTSVSIALREQARFLEAAELARRALAASRGGPAPRPGDTISALAALAAALRGSGNAAEAEPVYREVLALSVAHHGPRDIITARAISGLANVLRDRGNLAESEARFREALDIQRAAGDNVTDIARTVSSLGLLLASQRRYDEAEAFLREALERNRRWLGENHADVADDWSNLATLLFAREDLGGAESAARAALAIQYSLGRGSHPDTAHTLHTLGVVRYRLDELVGAEEALRAALEIRRANLPGHRLTAMTCGELGRCLTAQGRFEEAEPLLDEAHCTLSALLGPEHPYALAQLERLVNLYERAERPDLAATARDLLDYLRPPK